MTANPYEGVFRPLIGSRTGPPASRVLYKDMKMVILILILNNKYVDFGPCIILRHSYVKLMYFRKYEIVI